MLSGYVWYDWSCKSFYVFHLLHEPSKLKSIEFLYYINWFKVKINWIFIFCRICREIYSFQQSLDDRKEILDCLLLLDNVEVPNDLNNPEIPIVRISSLVMEKLSGIESSESTEAVALMRIPATFRDLNQEKSNGSSCRTWFPSTHRILVLDGIQVCLRLSTKCINYFPHPKLTTELTISGLSFLTTQFDPKNSFVGKLPLF